jgi:hypothetical protein
MKLYDFQNPQSKHKEQVLIPAITPTIHTDYTPAPDVTEDAFAWDWETLSCNTPTPPSPLMVLTKAAHTMPLLNVTPPCTSVAITPNPPPPMRMIHHSVVSDITKKQNDVIPRTAKAWKETEQTTLIPPLPGLWGL